MSTRRSDQCFYAANYIILSIAEISLILCLFLCHYFNDRFQKYLFRKFWQPFQGIVNLINTFYYKINLVIIEVVLGKCIQIIFQNNNVTSWCGTFIGWKILLFFFHYWIKNFLKTTKKNLQENFFFWKSIQKIYFLNNYSNAAYLVIFCKIDILFNYF